jgi:hypothetical protein
MDSLTIRGKNFSSFVPNQKKYGFMGLKVQIWVTKAIKKSVLIIPMTLVKFKLNFPFYNFPHE